MPLERLVRLHERLRRAVVQPALAAAPTWSHDAKLGRELFESMLLARHLDILAHELRARGVGHYTICSSGHESNVVFGRLTRLTDPSLLHYRSAALQIERARQRPSVDPVRDIALSLVASSEEPMSRGRHKLFGSHELGIVPQTSTIASHLPRAVGLGFALEQRRRLGLGESPADAIVLASFGDASINHSTALGAFNALSWTAHQKLPMPVLLVCEDNGLGISVRTPSGWVEERLSALPHCGYFAADGRDLDATWSAARAAVEHVRESRGPAVFHLRCVRLLGHAGSDVDTGYRLPAELADAEARDPLPAMAAALIAARALTAEELLSLDDRLRARVTAEAERAATRPRLTTRQEVMADIALAPESASPPPAKAAPSSEPMTLAQGINAALAEALDRYPETLLFGEDVAKKGGVYGLTKGLLARAGPSRVFNTLLDEQTILGLALGSAMLGFLPVPEIQYLAYLHNAEDQLRGEAATMRFFSAGAYDNPMLIRIAGLGYQKGFGGHFHNDNSLAVLRDVPGIVLFVPARADDALELYRSGFELARQARRVVVAVEPIALYHQRDLYADADGGWLSRAPAGSAELGRARVYDADARDLLIVTYGNGLRLSLRAKRRLSERGLSARVLDLRFIVPLPIADIVRHASELGRVLVVDECRQSGNVSEAVAAALLDERVACRFARVTSADSFIPLGDAAELVLVTEAEIVARGLELCGSG